MYVYDYTHRLLDFSLTEQSEENGESVSDTSEEFVLSHGDNVEASGFVQHLKLPHYVDFQSELELIRRAILKAVSIPGYQVPFGSREMPLPYGWARVVLR